MIERIVNSGLHHTLLGVLLVFAAAGFGIVSLQTVPSDVFPDLSTPIFNLIVQDASMAPEELEQVIAIPLETELNGLPGVRKVRSRCAVGIAQITVEFYPETDYLEARQYIAEKVSQVAAELPASVEPPLISSVSVRLNEVMELSLEAQPDTADLMSLRDLAEFDIGRRLASVPSVAAVERLGGHLRQFQILLDPQRMVARGVTLEQILHAAAESNLNASAGFLQRGESEWTVRALGRVTSIDELRRSMVTAKGGVPVLIGDVAEVREGGAIRRGIAHKVAGEVVSMRVIKQFGADTVSLSKEVNEKVAEIRNTLPAGVSISIDYDQGDVIDRSLHGLIKSILIGAVLVVLVLGLLLGDLRAAALVTLTIPLSIAISGIVLAGTNSGINAMTLGGLAIAVGLLVDAGIIICENVVHRLTEKRPPPTERMQVVGQACQEMARPISFAVGIIIAVFGPLLALTGIEGKLYRPLSLAVIGAVGASLFVSVLMLPGLARIFLRPKPVGKPDDVRLIVWLKKFYRPILEKSLRHAGLVCATSLLITIPALFLALQIGSDFLPKLDEGALLIQTWTDPDASLDLVDRLNHRIEDALRTFPEVKEVVRRTGRSERTEDPMPHVLSDLLVVLRENALRRGDELAAAMRPVLAEIPGIRSSFTTPVGMRIDEGLAGTPADLSVKIFGANLDRLQELAMQAEKILRNIPSLVDVRAERLGGLPQLRIAIDRDACNRIGVEVGEVARAISVMLVGEKVSETWVGSRQYDIVVRLSEAAYRDLPTLKTIRIDTEHGTTVPLEEIAFIEETIGPSTIQRESANRRITVESSVEDSDLSSAAAQVRTALNAKLSLPAGYYYELGGKIEGQERAQAALMVAIFGAGIAVFILLYLALNSWAETVVILITLPNAFVGGVFALWITGGSWDVSALVGLIGLFGIAVQNGLVLITQSKSLLAQGITFETAIREASISRMRPKLMTAACAIFGLLPLVLFDFRGAELERPLAIVMIGGLVTSTLFTLLALPTFYELVHKLAKKFAHPEVAE